MGVAYECGLRIILEFRILLVDVQICSYHSLLKWTCWPNWIWSWSSKSRMYPWLLHQLGDHSDRYDGVMIDTSYQLRCYWFPINSKQSCQVSEQWAAMAVKLMMSSNIVNHKRNMWYRTGDVWRWTRSRNCHHGRRHTGNSVSWFQLIETLMKWYSKLVANKLGLCST